MTACLLRSKLLLFLGRSELSGERPRKQFANRPAPYKESMPGSSDTCKSPPHHSIPRSDYEGI